MRKLVVNIKKKNKLAFIKELLKAFDYVEALEPAKLSSKEKNGWPASKKPCSR